MKVSLISFLLILFGVMGKVQAGILYSNEDSTIVVEIEKGNVSDKVDDAYLLIKGVDTSDLKCYWTYTDMDSAVLVCKTIREGLPIQVKIYNESGDSLVLTEVVEANAVNEQLNAVITPVVDVMAGVLFWDPFQAIGLHDGYVHDKKGQVLTHPNGDPVSRNIPFIVVWLVCGALFFTIRTKFVNVRGLKYSIGLLRGKYADDKEEGEVSHFQALTTALSATVGLGNIAGVAIAIVAGGPGAIFWMIVAGFLGMASKFVECTLGVKYRKIVNGVVSGGPMYYLSRGLERSGMKWLGRFLAILFAVLCVGGSFGGGNMFQSNQAFAQLQSNFPEYTGGGFYFGLVLALLVGVVIIGGIKKIAKVTDKIVPLMCGVYVLFALIIIGMNVGNIGTAFSKIIEGAFNGDALKGGFIGVLIQGFRRAAFSNEAGVGSASIAHSAVKTKRPITEGLVALLEPFIDTIVVCSMTALVLIFTGFDGSTGVATGSELTSLAFQSVFPWFSWVLLFAILLFAFSTMISWSYYGQKAWEYLFGSSKVSEYLYKFMFLCFVVLGASVDLGAVIDFSDLMILGMAIPNMLGLFILLPEVRKDLKEFISSINV